jgi:subtilisin family serine protease
MQVLSAMAGHLPGSLIGGAYKSDYILLKTEDSGRETKLEEIYWLLGAEYADSAGADILASSLGYNTFDNPADNYTLSQLDGETAIITKAADFAAGTGMVVVVSVGNEGNDSWGKLTFPSDADSVLAVGAVNSSQQYAQFSSRGNTVDKRIKPDVTAMGVGTVLASSQGGVATSNGTSFSSPQVAALAAGLWQTFPELNNMEILDLIRKSSDRYLAPDSLFGYGIPNYTKAKQIQINGIEDFEKFDPVIYPNPMETSPVTIVDSSFKSGELVDISLFDISIKKIYTKSIKSENGAVVINDHQLDNLVVGTYILKISSGKKNVSRKLIKK